MTVDAFRCYIALKRNRDNQKEAAAFLKKMMKCEVTAEHVAGNIVNNKNAEEKSDEQSLKDEEKAKQEKGIKISPQISLMCHEDFAVFFFFRGGEGGGASNTAIFNRFFKDTGRGEGRTSIFASHLHPGRPRQHTFIDSLPY